MIGLFDKDFTADGGFENQGQGFYVMVKNQYGKYCETYENTETI